MPGKATCHGVESIQNQYENTAIFFNPVPGSLLHISCSCTDQKTFSNIANNYTCQSDDI